MNRNSNGYVPNPIDFSHIHLPKELAPLVELIAEQVHETWAMGKMQSGFTFGELTDPVNKKHSCLKPFAELSEEDASYDRETAMATIKQLLALGWTLTPPTES